MTISDLPMLKCMISSHHIEFVCALVAIKFFLLFFHFFENFSYSSSTNIRQTYIYENFGNGKLSLGGFSAVSSLPWAR